MASWGCFGHFSTDADMNLMIIPRKMPNATDWTIINLTFVLICYMGVKQCQNLIKIFKKIKIIGLEEKGLTERKKQGIWELKRIALLVLGHGFYSMNFRKRIVCFSFLCVKGRGGRKVNAVVLFTWGMLRESGSSSRNKNDAFHSFSLSHWHTHSQLSLTVSHTHKRNGEMKCREFIE